MASQEANVNSISNNIANVNTTGFKKTRTEFEDLLYETVQEAGSRSNSNNQYTVGTQIGSGSKVSGIRRIHEQGSPMITGSPYDLMIQGDGFFGVSVGDEVLFTRDGAFQVNAEGKLQTKAGNSVIPEIVVPPNVKSLNISEDGTVEAFFMNKVEPSVLGKIPVFTFVNPTGLSDAGGNLARATAGSGAPIENIAGKDNSGVIVQGSLEASNVNVMNEMTNLIKAQRAYEMNSKVMGVADQMLQTVNNIR
jgi:flagellar basal-body rod protein FlgG